ncbi:MAG: Nramp family divalent metal transporter [Pirellulales bacterium]|nr:Nramp family divalent metal transporter [Thermoguttaceae bacterium]MDD4786364.1 Nramp family divalent metal transporter [Pirellulales bacterium]NLY99300.1 Nramp family divalent metal transporter [Pirellulaceae bacterium]
MGDGPSGCTVRAEGSAAGAIRTPPRSIPGILRQLGPGLIIAGAIVGSGELIATTKTGAQAGFWLLWLIIVGCVIKVFVQVEFGRYAISSGEGTMSAMDAVPGPRLRVNWLLWYWLVMFVFSLCQLGGIVHGVGQALAMSLPLDGSFNRLLAAQDAWDARSAPVREQLRGNYPDLASSRFKSRQAAVRQLENAVAERIGHPRPSERTPGLFWTDDITWAMIVTLVTIAILLAGRYAVIQNVSTAMVAAFTAATIFCVVAIQAHEAWAMHWEDLAAGLSFRLPPVVVGMSRWEPLSTALATFGIIGVGTSELVTYPYWCLEKGYARFTGPKEPSAAWADRARGWLRVMRWDAGVSMAIYTFATVAFYLLGAAVLHRSGLDPKGSQLIRTLGEMYVPVFGLWAKWLFLFGALAVLYSTFFVANAGHTRVASDAVRVFGIGARREAQRRWWIKAFCVFFPAFAAVTCILVRKPGELVLLSGVMQAIMLPMLAAATLYFRYRRCDRRITPGRLWDLMLWLSAVGMLIAGAWAGANGVLDLVRGLGL